MRSKLILVGVCMWVLVWPPLVQAQSMNDAPTNMFTSWGVGIMSPQVPTKVKVEATSAAAGSRSVCGRTRCGCGRLPRRD